MTFKLLTEHHLEFLSLKEGCTGSSELSLHLSCQNTTLLKITCRGSYVLLLSLPFLGDSYVVNFASNV